MGVGDILEKVSSSFESFVFSILKASLVGLFPLNYYHILISLGFTRTRINYFVGSNLFFYLGIIHIDRRIGSGEGVWSPQESKSWLLFINFHVRNGSRTC